MTDLPLTLDIARYSELWPDYEDLIRRAVSAAISVLDEPRLAELSVALSDDAHVRMLNRNYRSKDKPTNVLSFPVPPPAPMLGDIVLAYETLKRESEDKDITFEAHMSHLVIHGFFHLQGYDHQDEAEAIEMEALEVKALARLNIDNPYI